MRAKEVNTPKSTTSYFAFSPGLTSLFVTPDDVDQALIDVRIYIFILDLEFGFVYSVLGSQNVFIHHVDRFIVSGLFRGPRSAVEW